MRNISSTQCGRKSNKKMRTDSPRIEISILIALFMVE